MSQPSDFPFESSWLPLLKDLGVNARDVMRRAGLPEDLLSRSGSRISTQDYFRFWRALERSVDDPAVALRLVETLTTEAFSPAMFAALCSPNLQVAVERLANYKRLIAPMQLELTETPDALRLVVRWLRNEDTVPESWAGAELAFLVRLARIGTREHLTPRRVTAPRRLEPESAYREFFGVGVSEAPEYALEFQTSDVKLPFLTANELMWQSFEPELRRRLAELDRSSGVSERVRDILLEALPSGQSGMDRVARRLAVSRRTLQRKLNEEGTTYQKLLSETREALARHYLARTDLSCTEISFLLGFEDPNSFFRAYHNWTGQTPVAHRQRLANTG
ncbi:MAG: AraC family transcriptional regulator [Polyangiaceae bacterium]|nr:AraC family transcriptional regulator [Myxococcales bacterium]MCB9586230.1 AraC family transcriptional regulator [Polyangiaceae bacterium]